MMVRNAGVLPQRHKGTKEKQEEGEKRGWEEPMSAESSGSPGD
jgi:hypothetical protein